MRRKAVLLVITLVFLVGLVSAQPADAGPSSGSQSPDTGQDNTQTGSENTPPMPDEQQNSQKPDEKGPNNPGLPEQASNTAKNVVDTVFGAIGNGAKSIGDAVSSIFGG